MKAEILKMLREADGYISGQEICEKFNVSRTAVWKVIRRLQEDGYEVEAVRNKRVSHGGKSRHFDKRRSGKLYAYGMGGKKCRML